MAEKDKLGRRNPGGKSRKGITKVVTTEEMAELFTLAALNNGHMSKAVELFNEQHPDHEPVIADTARMIRRNHRELYDRISREVTERVRTQAAEKHMAAAEEALDVSAKIAKKLIDPKVLDKIPERDLPGAYRNAVTVAGIHTDKALALTGDSSPGVSINISIGETLRGLASRGQRFYDEQGNEMTLEEAMAKATPTIESTAEEVEDGES